MAKYVAGAAVAIAVTEYVRVEVPFGSLVAVLTLAELYQANGRHDEAIGLLQQLVELDPDPALVLSLCDLYAETGAWAEIIDVAAGTRNDDDISLQVRLFQAEALERQGMNDAALEAYKDALRSTKRDGELIKAARYGRGRLYSAAWQEGSGPQGPRTRLRRRPALPRRRRPAHRRLTDRLTGTVAPQASIQVGLDALRASGGTTLAHGRRSTRVVVAGMSERASTGRPPRRLRRRLRGARAAGLVGGQIVLRKPLALQLLPGRLVDDPVRLAGGRRLERLDGALGQDAKHAVDLARLEVELHQPALQLSDLRPLGSTRKRLLYRISHAFVLPTRQRSMHGLKARRPPEPRR